MIPLLDIAVVPVSHPYHEPFVISRGTIIEEKTIEVTLTGADGHVGRGEASGISYERETPETMMMQIAAVEDRIRTGIDQNALLSLLPIGGARNAIDAALWDIEAKRSGIDPFTRANVSAAPVATGLTIGIRSLDGYAERARAAARSDCIKIKVGGDDPVAAVEAVRANAPDVRLIVDPNQAWSVADLKRYAPEMARLGVNLLEQPIAVGEEAGLDGYRCPVMLAADELIHDASDLRRAQGRFDVINIKLDKSGGLTAGIALADAALAMGFDLMIGCMGGTSLAMAPAMVIAQRCRFIDLDGPLMLDSDCPHGFAYVDGRVANPHQPLLWG